MNSDHFNVKQPPNDHLAVTSIFLPIARSSQALPYFENLMSMSLTEDNVTIVAMDLGKIINYIKILF